ncbi:MAG: hypothetical protein Q8L34_05190 [Candidatus Woesearchaeota archaeon]|nr:hypothetical protein [Candidatus Woesearchaeota archaeon]
MKQTIQYLFKPEQPLAPDYLQGIALPTNLSVLLTPQDRQLIHEEWRSVLQSHPKVFSQPNGLGSLLDTSTLPKLYFNRTDFQTYVTTSRLADRGTPLATMSPAMRVSAVGCAVHLLDGTTLLHKRPSHATHVPDKYDAGVAGLAHVEPNGTLNFVKWLREKFARELKVGEEDLTDLQLTSLHSGSAPDCSGMVDFSVHLPYEFGDLQQRANPAYFQGMLAVSQSDIPQTLIDMFALGDDLIADGAAVLLSSLPHKQFLQTVAAINSLNGLERRILFGTLQTGVFVEQKQ